MSECKRKKLILFWDSGDTIVEEVTEVRNERGIVTSAKLHEGCTELLLRLYQEGFRMALVADGEVESFENIYRQHELESVFEVRAVSEALPERKPAAIMFQTALDGLGLCAQDKERIVMIGNHLMRDIGGANHFGITSIFFDWTTRYTKEPQALEEQPDYIAHSAEELYELIQRLEAELRGKENYGEPLSENS
ncbi:MAG: HAD family hydrolase [Lachnospiraceae bacterium]|nr:HAD family hydrolase [Lachnospiraceae bacterium]